MDVLLLAVAGGAGAVCRWGVATGVRAAWADDRAGALATALVNLAGAFALGLLVGSSPTHRTLLIVGTGLLGGFTTFSTWMLEAVVLRRVSRAASLIDLVVPLALGLAAAAVGLAVGRDLGVPL